MRTRKQTQLTTTTSPRVAGADPRRVLLCCDDQLVLLGLQVCLEKLPGFEAIGSAGPRDVLGAVARLRPDIVVLEVPRLDLTIRPLLGALAARLPTVVLCQDPDPAAARRAMQAGCRAFLARESLSVSGLHHTLTGVAAGEFVPPARGRPGTGGLAEASGLSPREVDVMTAIARGQSNRDIAASLMVTEKTIKNYINRLFPKLGVRTRAEAIVVWLSGAPDAYSTGPSGGAPRPRSAPRALTAAGAGGRR